MSAHLKNRYAEKWTYANTIERLHAIDKSSREDTCLFLGQALSTSGLYQDVWRYWRKKWKKQSEIISHMKQIMQRFEVRIFTKMANKEMPASVGMFALKHHYGWGKEPSPNTASEDLSYVDEELINEKQVRFEEEMERQEAIIDPPVTEETLLDAGCTPEGPPKIQDVLTQVVTGVEFKVAIATYNALHPNNPISRPCTYVKGPIPEGLDCIPFEFGYFIKPQVMKKAA